MADFAGWIPIRFYWKEGRVWVDWCYLGARAFWEPFFDQTIDRCLLDPACALFRRQTPIEELVIVASQLPCCTPRGFIFHMSRCGSTLIAQMLAALPQNVVLSEPSPIDWILRAHLAEPAWTEDHQVAWLRSTLAALAQQRTPMARHCFVKFHSWHILQLPLVQRAFPEVPWLFVYRDPVEVMVSHQRQPTAQTMPVGPYPRLLGLDTTACLDAEEYSARVLGRLCQVAGEHARGRRGLLLNYRELPTAVVDRVAKWFGLRCHAEDVENMRDAAQSNAKEPHRAFAQDSLEKQEKATPRLRQFARQWAYPAFEQLEAGRDAQLSTAAGRH